MTEREPSEESAGADGDRESAAATGREGSRIVIRLYLALVAVATTAGLLTGTFVEGLTAPRFLFVVPLPPTPLGFALYGGLTVALVLGVPLALVVYVSQSIDDATE